MHTTQRRLIPISILSLAIILLPALAEHHEAPAGAPEMTAEMQQMLALAGPGPEHEFFEQLVGNWQTESTFWMDPTQPPTTTLGKASSKLIMGGRFLQSEFTGEFMGMPFQGLGIDGYDRVQEKFVSVWMDNMGTMIMQMYGSLDRSGKILTMFCDYIDPMTRKSTEMKTVTTILSDKEHKFEYFTKGPDGKFSRGMEMIYTRR